MIRFDDGGVKVKFYPFSKLKSVEDLRVGIFTFGERIKRVFGEDFLSRDYIFVPNFIPFSKPRFKEPVIMVSGEVVGVSSSVRDRVWEMVERGDVEEIDGIYISNFWEIPLKISDVFEKDVSLINLEEFYRINDFFVHKTAELSLKSDIAGMGVIDRYSKVTSFVVMNGPVYVGERSLVKPFSFISVSIIGPVCKVCGEISNTVFEGFSNKQHGGFVGHSYIGSWVNIGAGTEVSNLKNTYGTVKVYSYERGGLTDTGQQFLGMFAGDHAKIGINTTVSTGTVMGIFCNITALDSPTDKFIPDFYWTGGGKMRLEKAIEMAKRVMARRGVKSPDEYIEIIKMHYE